MESGFDVSTEGVLDSEIVTFAGALDDKADRGKPVKLTGNDTVALCSDGDDIHGFVSTVENGAVGVSIGGSIDVEYNDAGVDGAPSLGYQGIIAAADGKVKKAARVTASNRMLVVSKDSTAKTVRILFSAR